MLPILLREAPVKGRCLNSLCKRENKNGSLCSSCSSRRFRLADPVKYAFQNIKDRAKQRGKEFTITLDEFREFCFKTEYIGRKGKTSQSYSIDRVREEEGYHIWNIQVLPLGENVRKKFLNYDPRTKTAKVSTMQPSENEDNFF